MKFEEVNISKNLKENIDNLILNFKYIQHNFTYRKDLFNIINEKLNSKQISELKNLLNLLKY